MSQYHGCIHQAAVVGDEDVGPSRVDFFQPFNTHLDAAHSEQHMRDQMREMLCWIRYRPIQIATLAARSFP